MAGTSSNDIEMNPALYYTDTLSLICNVLARERSSLHEAFEGIVGQIILVLILVLYNTPGSDRSIVIY